MTSKACEWSELSLLPRKYSFTEVHYDYDRLNLDINQIFFVKLNCLLAQKRLRRSEASDRLSDFLPPQLISQFIQAAS
jgi:hypothetical protein